MNRVFLLGRLTRDPEIRTTQAGKMVTSFTLAVDRFVGSKETDFISIVVWDKLAEICGNNLFKGQRAMVEGRWQNRSYEGKDGVKRYVSEVIASSVEFLDRRSNAASDTASDTASQFGKDIPEDELPY